MPLFSTVWSNILSDLLTDFEHCFKMMFLSLSGPVALFIFRFSNIVSFSIAVKSMVFRIR